MVSAIVLTCVSVYKYLGILRREKEKVGVNEIVLEGADSPDESNRMKEDSENQF